jgi:hypothetical protein
LKANILPLKLRMLFHVIKILFRQYTNFFVKLELLLYKFPQNWIQLQWCSIVLNFHQLVPLYCTTQLDESKLHQCLSVMYCHPNHGQSLGWSSSCAMYPAGEHGYGQPRYSYYGDVQ